LKILPFFFFLSVNCFKQGKRGQGIMKNKNKFKRMTAFVCALIMLATIMLKK
jgi:hypothetical protein